MKTGLPMAFLTLFVLTLTSTGAAVRYVNGANFRPVPPYATWTTAATTIQDAVDIAEPSDQIVVTNGVYEMATVSSEEALVTVRKPVTLQSVNGPEKTIIDAGGFSRCVFLGEGAKLVGFTLTNGSVFGGGGGGGVWCSSTDAVVSNCVLSGNSASQGGGAYWGTLNNCIVNGNWAGEGGGGGVYGGTLNNCTLMGNSSGYGGGALEAALNHCELTGNWAGHDGGGAYGSTLENCTINSNSAGSFGGGVAVGILNSCTLMGNSATQGGGADAGTLNNCSLIRNLASDAGGGAYGSMLTNCTLTGNSATNFGGGTAGCILNDCTISANSARYGGGAAGNDCFFECNLKPPATLNKCALTGNAAILGGGAYYGTLNNCLLTGNSAIEGGGAFRGTLHNCTVTANSAGETGGGVAGGSRIFNDQMVQMVLNNCIVYFNNAPYGAEYYRGQDGILNYSCTTPAPSNGVGNFTNAPLFVNQDAGNLRLQPDSPCINAGRNGDAVGETDIDGNARIAGGTVDIGAYEFRSPQSLICYAWLQQYHLPTDGSADNLDLDGDYLTNFQEWRAGTDPTNALSALRLLTPRVSDLGLVSWESVPGRTYSLERSETLGDFQSFVPFATGIPAAPDGNLTTYFDFGADIFSLSWFYRARVE